jgi:hypothetical protein
VRNVAELPIPLRTPRTVRGCPVVLHTWLRATPVCGEVELVVCKKGTDVSELQGAKKKMEFEHF